MSYIIILASRFRLTLLWPWYDSLRKKRSHEWYSNRSSLSEVVVSVHCTLEKNSHSNFLSSGTFAQHTKLSTPPPDRHLTDSASAVMCCWRRHRRSRSNLSGQIRTVRISGVCLKDLCGVHFTHYERVVYWQLLCKLQQRMTSDVADETDGIFSVIAWTRSSC